MTFPVRRPHSAAAPRLSGAPAQGMVKGVPCPIERASLVPSRGEREGTALWGRAVAAARPGMEASFSSGGPRRLRQVRECQGVRPRRWWPGAAVPAAFQGRADRGSEALSRAGRASASVRHELARRRELGGPQGRAVCWPQGEQQEGAGPARGLCGGGCCRGKTPVRVRSPSESWFCVTPTYRRRVDTGQEISVNNSEVIRARIEKTGGSYIPDLYVSNLFFYYSGQRASVARMNSLL